MSRVAHLSDVHFGAHDPAVVAGAEAWLAEARPDLVVISGDFTQRARTDQYREAAAFLDRIEALGLPTLGVPGNHDVPLYDLVRRFTRPLHRYRRYIDDDLCPWFENDRLAVLGINTARSLTFKDGRISHEQMAIIRDRFRDVPKERTRILVTHHPLFAMPIGEAGEPSEAVGRHGEALEAIAEAGVHILLAGHFHRSFTESARRMVRNAGAGFGRAGRHRHLDPAAPRREPELQPDPSRPQRPGRGPGRRLGRQGLPGREPRPLRLRRRELAGGGGEALAFSK